MDQEKLLNDIQEILQKTRNDRETSKDIDHELINPAYNIPVTPDESNRKPTISSVYKGYNNSLWINGSRLLGARVSLEVPGRDSVVVESRFISNNGSSILKISNMPSNFKFGFYRVYVTTDYGEAVGSCNVGGAEYPDPIPPVPAQICESFEGFSSGVNLNGVGYYGTWYNEFLINNPIKVQSSIVRTGSKGIALGVSPNIPASLSPTLWNISILVVPDSISALSWTISYYFKTATYGTGVGQFPGSTDISSFTLFNYLLSDSAIYCPALTFNSVGHVDPGIKMALMSPGSANLWNAAVNPSYVDVFDGRWHKLEYTIDAGTPGMMSYWIDDTWGQDNINLGVAVSALYPSISLYTYHAESEARFDSDLYIDDFTFSYI